MSNQASALLTHSSDDCNILRQQIQTSLQRAETQRNRLKNVERRFGIVNICFGAAATFIAGQSAISDNPLIGNWRATTTVASVITLSSTIIGGVQKQLAAPDLLTEASECVAKLKALKVETISPAYEVEPVSEEYQQILSDFSKVDC
ncbi:hypothetical protein H6F88_00275 [Oculatella sp. FACHB-28]|uniref:hypothetical protein n=1 Tax=Oculatella sp. FACHB-28 TaxID=2692845 RepID=UPI00168974B0|nr:hypothetical protein [Oculatella sp. FACHB-28]MBD2054485.1 hypothetical protein [Oculatella sp. FACHB-28]